MGQSRGEKGNRCVHPWRGSSFSPESHPALFYRADNTAAVHTQHVGFNRQEQDVFLLPILVVDSGPPTLSSTGTLTIRICGCDSSGTIQSCNTTAFVMAASLSPGALIALLVCVLILVGESKRQPGYPAQIDHALGEEPGIGWLDPPLTSTCTSCGKSPKCDGGPIGTEFMQCPPLPSI